MSKKLGQENHEESYAEHARRGLEPSTSKLLRRSLAASVASVAIFAIASLGGVREAAAQVSGSSANAQATAFSGGTGQTTTAQQDYYPVRLARQGYLFVAGHYVNATDGQNMTGQMYVEYQVPFVHTRPYPIVMIHGSGQTG
ncbi:MAG: hypothetical protein ACRYGM_11775, partial [Janthinobacterium lividum]